MMTERARYWQEHLDRWARSVLSQAAFCRRHGLKAVTFGWWKRKLVTERPHIRRRGAGAGRASSVASCTDFVEVAMTSAGMAAYEVVLSGGVVLPAQPIGKGLPGPGLLAHVITSKYCDHLPLYRLERILGRHGVDLSRSTMCGWMAACGELLHPLYRLMVEDVLASKVVHRDDTVVPVQDKTRAKTRQGRAWVYVGDHHHPHTVFDYTPNRSRDGPLTFLESFTGYLQADAYSGYHALYTTGRVMEVACWAHTRRKFHESRETDPARAHAAIAMIRLLYKVEEEAGDLSSDERKALRQARSKPRLEQIEEWLQKERITALPKSPIGQAIGYALNNWTALTRYVDDGDLHIDNNPAENAIRPIVLGRKNWLFAGSDKGGRTAAVLSSFIASCRRQEIDPFAYLRDVLTHFAACPINEIDQFLPARWKAARRIHEA